MKVDLTCKLCKGKGKYDQHENVTLPAHYVDCPDCNGLGYYESVIPTADLTPACNDSYFSDIKSRMAEISAQAKPMTAFELDDRWVENVCKRCRGLGWLRETVSPTVARFNMCNSCLNPNNKPRP